jgi:hypothetical protein
MALAGALNKDKKSNPARPAERNMEPPSDALNRVTPKAIETPGADGSFRFTKTLFRFVA